MDQVLQQLRVQAGTEHELAPYVHAPDEVLPQLALSLGLNDHDGVLEIGCGDARILCYLAERHGCALTGVEVDAQAFADAQEYIEQRGLGSKVRLLHGDAMSLDLPWHSYTVVFMYLTVSGLKQVWEPLTSRLRPGTKIVSIQFQAPADAVETNTCSFVDHKGHDITFTFHTYIV